MGSIDTISGLFVRVERLGIRISICAGVSLNPVSVSLRVVGKRGCRGLWIMIKVCHAGHVTEHALFIIVIELCDFEIFLELSDCSVQDIVDMLHLVSL